MLSKALFLTLLCILCLDKASARIEITYMEPVVVNYNYLNFFNMYVVDARTSNMKVHVSLHVVKDFPLNSKFQIVFYTSMPGKRKINLGYYYSMVCQHDTNFDELPIFLQKLAPPGRCIQKKKKPQSFDDAGYFDMDNLLEEQYTKVEYPITNINTLLGDNNTILFQYKVTAWHYPEPDQKIEDEFFFSDYESSDIMEEDI